MNSLHSRKHYGKLSLTTSRVREIQLEWAMLEQPAQPRRFLNFPFADHAACAPVVTPLPSRKERRPLAA
jgi:hypothetical protein